MLDSNKIKDTGNWIKQMRETKEGTSTLLILVLVIWLIISIYTILKKDERLDAINAIHQQQINSINEERRLEKKASENECKEQIREWRILINELSNQSETNAKLTEKVADNLKAK